MRPLTQRDLAVSVSQWCRSTFSNRLVRLCSSRQRYWRSFLPTAIRPRSEAGEHLRVCPQGYTCCTSEMEEQLSNMSRQEVEKLVREAGRSLQTSLQNQYRSFDGYFLELLNRSEYSLLHSLRSTEGQHYAQNAHVFRDLYSDLRDHYRGNGVNLEEALNDLWARLLEQFLRASDPQRDMGDDFLECASKQADLLRPFGDAPRDLKLKAIRTFVVARSFRQGLLVSAEVVRKVSQVPLSPECNNAIMRLTYCPQCRGLVDIKPCTSYCRNVMKGCLANQADLDTEWGNLVDAMLQVAERFKGASGVEMFVLALSAHLSDAVLSMQENAEVFSSKVMDTCRKLKDMQQYWTQLPNALCKVTAGAANEENCWNGVAQARYLPQVMGDGLANQINNPEVEIDITKPDMTVRQQIMQLKITTNRLKNAFDGNDVDFLDTSDDISGSGSGMCHGDLCHHDPRLSIPRTDQPNIFAYPAEKKGVRGSGNKTILCSVLLVLSLITVLLQR
ncbi:glypican-1-like [Scleropages formosus]|uniref:Glypican-1 n=1 Tax=Scleropages formosus TaxID=113540 RepID=A0A0P7UZ39_SCLFO|nr:glypican-1-like [Scleropages formosus]